MAMGTAQITPCPLPSQHPAKGPRGTTAGRNPTGRVSGIPITTRHREQQLECPSCNAGEEHMGTAQDLLQDV